MDVFRLVLAETDLTLTQTNLSLAQARSLLSQPIPDTHIPPKDFILKFNEKPLTEFAETADLLLQKFHQKHQFVGQHADAVVSQIPRPQVVRVSKSRLQKLQPDLIAARTASIQRDMRDKAALKLQRWTRNCMWRRRFRDYVSGKVKAVRRIQEWYRGVKRGKGLQKALRFRGNRLKVRSFMLWKVRYVAVIRLRKRSMSGIAKWTWFKAHLECAHEDFQAIRPVEGVFEVAKRWRRWRLAARCTTLWQVFVTQR